MAHNYTKLKTISVSVDASDENYPCLCNHCKNNYMGMCQCL